jgi:hypothetical protein
MPPNEQRNFLDCVKSRQPTTYTAEADQRLSTTMHVGNIAMRLGRKLKWDPKAETFPSDEAANALCSRVARDDRMKRWRVAICSRNAKSRTVEGRDGLRDFFSDRRIGELLGLKGCWNSARIVGSVKGTVTVS